MMLVRKFEEMANEVEKGGRKTKGTYQNPCATPPWPLYLSPYRPPFPQPSPRTSIVQGVRVHDIGRVGDEEQELQGASSPQPRPTCLFGRVWPMLTFASGLLPVRPSPSPSSSLAPRTLISTSSLSRSFSRDYHRLFLFCVCTSLSVASATAASRRRRYLHSPSRHLLIFCSSASPSRPHFIYIIFF